jgi:hypothetical protein
MSEIEPHPGWCDRDRCLVRPGAGGTHVSARLELADHRKTTVLYADRSEDGPYTVVVLEVPDQGEDEPSVVVTWRLDTAIGLHGLLGDLIAAVETDSAVPR